MQGGYPLALCPVGCALQDQHQTLLWGRAEPRGGLCSLRGGSSHSAVTLQVEVWLNRVLERMRSTLRNLIPQALGTYEDKPREQWVFDYPAQVGAAAWLWEGQGQEPEPWEAQQVPLYGHGVPMSLQVALTCTQIAWTSEVGVAFASLEKGYENALKDYNKKQVGTIHP